MGFTPLSELANAPHQCSNNLTRPEYRHQTGVMDPNSMRRRTHDPERLRALRSPRRFEVPPSTLTAASEGSAQYEFSFVENATIAKLGSKMSFVGLFMLGIGLFFFVSGLVRWVQTHNLEVSILFLALMFMVVGIWTHRAGREFLKVAETEGNDVSHLMDALANLLKFYTLLYLLFFVALVFAIIQLGAHSLYGTRQSTPGSSGSITPRDQVRRARRFPPRERSRPSLPDRPRQTSGTSRSPAGR